MHQNKVPTALQALECPVGKLDNTQITRQLADHVPDLHECGFVTRRRVLCPFAKGLGIDSHTLYLELCKAYAKSRESYRRTQSRTSIEKTSSGKWHIRKVITLKAAEQAQIQHFQTVETPEKLVKNDRKRRLSRVLIDDRSYIVKEFTCPGPWGPFAPDSKSWRAAAGLETYGIRACRYYAWLKMSDRRSIMILQDLGNKNLHNLFKKMTSSHERRKYLILAGKLIGYLHNLRVFHRDLKDDNFIIDDHDQVSLIDLDAVRFASAEIPRARLKNLTQFCDRLPGVITTWERTFFFAAYRKETNLPKCALLKLIRQIPT